MRLKNGENHLTQWDRHQVLVFTEYPPGTELHMWCDFFAIECIIFMKFIKDSIIVILIII